MTGSEPEIITVQPGTDEVYCDGGGGPLGHPGVWYALEGRSSVTCAYCSRVFKVSEHST